MMAFKKPRYSITCIQRPLKGCNKSGLIQQVAFKPLPDMPNLGSSNSAANKDMMSKIWPNGVSIISI